MCEFHVLPLRVDGHRTAAKVAIRKYRTEPRTLRSLYTVRVRVLVRVQVEGKFPLTRDTSRTLWVLSPA